jgi:hypothetical protein
MPSRNNRRVQPNNGQHSYFCQALAAYNLGFLPHYFWVHHEWDRSRDLPDLSQLHEAPSILGITNAPRMLAEYERALGKIPHYLSTGEAYMGAVGEATPIESLIDVVPRLARKLRPEMRRWFRCGHNYGSGFIPQDPEEFGPDHPWVRGILRSARMLPIPQWLVPDIAIDAYDEAFPFTARYGFWVCEQIAELHKSILAHLNANLAIERAQRLRG